MSTRFFCKTFSLVISVTIGSPITTSCSLKEPSVSCHSDYLDGSFTLPLTSPKVFKVTLLRKSFVRLLCSSLNF